MPQVYVAGDASQLVYRWSGTDAADPQAIAPAGTELVSATLVTGGTISATVRA